MFFCWWVFKHIKQIEVYTKYKHPSLNQFLTHFHWINVLLLSNSLFLKNAKQKPQSLMNSQSIPFCEKNFLWVYNPIPAQVQRFFVFSCGIF